jgi:WD40 repeat protein
MKKYTVEMICLLLIAVAGTVLIKSGETTGPIAKALALQSLNASGFTAASPFDAGNFSRIALRPDGRQFAIIDEHQQIRLTDSVLNSELWVQPGAGDSAARGLLFSSNGKALLSLGDAEIDILDTATGNNISSIRLPETSGLLTKAAVNGDASRVAVATGSEAVLLWNLKTNPETPIVLGKNQAIDRLSFSPDGQSLVAVIKGQTPHVIVWDSQSGKVRFKTEAGAKIADIAFDNAGNTLALAGEDGKIVFWKLRTGQAGKTISTQAGTNRIAFSPNGKNFVSASGSGRPQIQFWNLASGESLFVRQTDEEGVIEGIAFNADGSILASVNSNHQISLLRMPDGELVDVLKGTNAGIRHSAFINNNPYLITAGDDGQIVVWNVAAGTQHYATLVSVMLPVDPPVPLPALAEPTSTATANNPPPSTAISAGAQLRAAAPVAEASAVSIPRKKRSIKNRKGITAFAFSKDGTEMGAAVQDGSIRIYGANGRQRLRLAGHHGSETVGIGFKATGKKWVTVGRDTEIKIWDDATGKELKTLRGPEHPPRTSALSPDGKLFAVGGEDTRIFIFDTDTLKLKTILNGHVDFVNGMAFSADNLTLASAGADGRIILWEMPSGKKLRTLLGHADEVNAVAFNNNGSLLASGSRDSTVKLWSLANGVMIKSFSGHQGTVRSVAFSPDGSSLVSAGEDSKVLVWDTNARQLKKQIAGIVSAVNAIVFGQDGNLNVGTEDSKVTEINTGTGGVVSTPVNLQSEIVSPQSSNNPGVQNYLDGNLGSSIAYQANTRNYQSQTVAKRQQPVGTVAWFNRVLDWLVPTAEAALPDPNIGPGGPILVLVSSADPFGKYFAEILRTEGLNSFAVADINTVNATSLTSFDVVILARMTLSAGQVTMLTNWVNAGGNLIAMRPDAQLYSLLGLTSAGTPIDNGYLLLDTSAAPGSGLVNQTLQFHGAADRYSPTTAGTLATLYSNANTATTNAAVTLNAVGSSGGQAAAFAYDLASSIVYTRQGNPAWATQERDGFSPIRSDDKFYGAAASDNQPDWVNLEKVAIPQADEQQRLLANLILEMNKDKKPLPRFWYFPKGLKAVVLMTGDDHGNNGTEGRFNQFISLSEPGCSVADWECIRGTSYIFPNTPLSDQQALAFENAGFEVGLHVNTGCADFTTQSLRDNYTQQIQALQTNFPSISAPTTERHHCIAWSDWASGAVVQLEKGIRLDTSYYFWPPVWVQDRPGFFTGSGMPMRFANLDGSMLDVYHAASQMTDESGQTYPFTINSLLNKAVGPEGYYGVFTINAHTDLATIPQSDAVVASAQSKGVPVVSAKQMLEWLDGRNNSSFSAITWNSNALTFTITPGVGSRNLRGMVPANVSAGILLSLSYIPSGGGSSTAVSFTTEVVKGIGYGMFEAKAGTYTATYGADTTPPAIESKSPAAGATAVSLGTPITAVFNEYMDPASISGSTFELKDASDNLVSATVSYNPSNKTAILTPLAALSATTVYTATVKGGGTDPRVKDLSGNAMASNASWSFTTEAQPCSSTDCTALGSSQPLTASAGDSSAVELGVKFKADISGYVKGVRFYKAPTNTGTHIGNLWSATGGLLATATFTAETATGWQQVTFSNPVAINANTTYVASYFAPNGNYAASSTPAFLSQEIYQAPLHLLMNGADGGNGVYAYGSASSFPSNTYNGTNYWVDVLFTTVNGGGTIDTEPPTVTARTPTDGETNVSPTTAVTISFNEAINPATVTASTLILRDAANAVVPAAVSYNNATNTATLVPTTVLSTATAYTVTAKGGTVEPRIKDVAGNALSADAAWSFTTSAVVQQGCNSNTYSIWPSTASPIIASDGDSSAVELGVKFRPSINGYICGVRFYKGASNTGTHTGNLWSNTGTLLASAIFTNESASGWQQVNFGAPVPVVGNQLYVASYHAPVGRYAADVNGLISSVSNVQANLTAPSSSTSGGNGVFLYGSGGFPAGTFNATNYWVDVAFTTSLGPDNTEPEISSTSPASNAVNVLPTAAITIVFNEPMSATSVNGTTITLRDGQSNLVPATVTLDSGLTTATLTPSAELSSGSSYTVKVSGGASGVKDVAQNALQNEYAWSFQTGSNPCSPGGNAIVCENTKPGNPASEWDVSGSGDASIQGFATDISVNVGQTVRFKIDTPSTNYRLDIYRMGYYNGDGARKIATIQPSAFPAQPACQTNGTGLLDCGNWIESASWAVPSNAVSGIYFAKAVRQDGNGGASHIVFIVRNDASHSDVLFQTADTTWQAYNNYGGNSFYGGSGPGTGGGGDGRAYKLSYNRPFVTRSVDNGQDWVFNAEYPMVRWLEANGYDVSYFTGVDSDRFGTLIKNHKLFLSNGHDEYWSGQQRINVEAARDASSNPVNLAFFSGNEVFWKTRWENSIDGSATPYRTLVCYKETHNYPNNADPDTQWTGTFRDPRGTPPAIGGDQPENSLTGTLFMVNDGATTSISVPEADGKMRFWRNTAIANLATGASATLPNETLGYEWDIDTDNDFRPAGLVRLSTTIYPGAPMVTPGSYGSSFSAGLANHALTLYRAASGAMVFGSGTVQWAWGLDSNHDRGSNAPNPAMQQATVNLFADMGVQPSTLQVGLLPASASTDNTAPVSAITTPTATSPITPGSQVVINGTASDVNGRVGGVEVSVDNGATWHPASGRGNWTYAWTAPSTTGQVILKSRAVDDSLNMEVAGVGVTVNVGSDVDTTPPTVPANLQAVQVSATSVNLTWTASTDASGIPGYRVERCVGTSCTDFAEISAPASGVTTFTDNGLTEGAIYQYRVRAADASNNLSGFSNVVTIRPDGTPPTTPLGLTATASGSTNVSLSWTASTDNVGVTGYQVQRCASAGCSDFAQVGLSTAASFVDSGLITGTTYQYRVQALDAAGNFVFSGYHGSNRSGQSNCDPTQRDLD